MVHIRRIYTQWSQNRRKSHPKKRKNHRKRSHRKKQINYRNQLKHSDQNCPIWRIQFDSPAIKSSHFYQLCSGCCYYYSLKLLTSFFIKIHNKFTVRTASDRWMYVILHYLTWRCRIVFASHSAGFPIFRSRCGSSRHARCKVDR